MFNKLPYEIQEKILNYIFNTKINNKLCLEEFAHYCNEYIKNNNKKDYFNLYWFNLHKIKYSYWTNWNVIYNKIFIDRSYFKSNKCTFCNCLTHTVYLLDNNLYNKFPKYKKLKNEYLILNKNIIRNYVNLVIYENLIICGGCYHGYSKNKNIKFYINY